jgi:alpha-L-rhamnosidase
MKRIFFLSILISSLLQAAVAPYSLRCNLVRDPERTQISYPRLYFSWQIPGHRGADRQAGYQIQVSSTLSFAEALHADVWDSGWLASEESVHLLYTGHQLYNGKIYYWRVRTRTADNRTTPFSMAQSFQIAAQDSSSFPRENIDWRDRSTLCQDRITPQRVRQKGPGRYFLDFGRAAFATLAFPRFSAQEGQITIHLGEVLASPDSVHRQPGGSRRYRKMVCNLSDINGTILRLTPDQRNTSGNAVLVPPSFPEVLPFRYVEMEHVPPQIKPEQIIQLTLHYPFDERAAEFSSSSTILNDIWELCKYSIKATSFLGVYIDGDRERIPYEGDAYINQLSHYAVDAEYAMPRYTIQYLLHHPTWPVEWQQHMILMAWADYIYTGQSDLLAKYYDALSAKTLLALAREDGLIVEDRSRMSDDFLRTLRLSQPPRVLVDWPPADFTKNSHYGERDGYDMKPVNAVANAFHYHTLVLMGRIADVLQKNDDVTLWQERASRVRHAYNKVFFNGQRGYYIDGESSDHSALHANFFPLAFGLVENEHVASVVRFIKSRGMACSVYGAQHLLDALYLVGEADYALALLTATHDRSWAHMMYDMKSTITTEAWDNKYKENQDWNHAWGAAPGNIIARRLMGIEPTAAGFKRVRIHPQLGSLNQARIVLPTLRGDVQVRVQQGVKLWQAWIDIPAQMAADIVVPGTDTNRIRENGRNLARDRAVCIDEDGVVIPVSSGHFHYQVDISK